MCVCVCVRVHAGRAKMLCLSQGRVLEEEDGQGDVISDPGCGIFQSRVGRALQGCGERSGSSARMSNYPRPAEAKSLPPGWRGKRDPV